MNILSLHLNREYPTAAPSRGGQYKASLLHNIYHCTKFTRKMKNSTCSLVPSALQEKGKVKHFVRINVQVQPCSNSMQHDDKKPHIYQVWDPTELHSNKK